MDEIGQLRWVALHYIMLVWGILALLISAVYFFCEYRPQKCEAFKEWLVKNYPPRRGKGGN
jgi:hypothetical protein